MTVNDLRERTKAAYAAFRAYRDDTMQAYDIWNMHQAWSYCFNYSEHVRLGTWQSATFKEPYHKVVVAFARAGDVYYYAKKHGIEAAMLRKLSS